MHHEWMKDLTACLERGEACVLVTVLEAKGSTPREAGTKMVVTEKGQQGTIGGGNLEFQAVAEARALLAVGEGKPQRQFYPLGPKLAQCCGGAVTVLLEPFCDTAKTICLFGAGHVGKDVVKVLENLPVRVLWVDVRAEEFPAVLPSNCRKIISDDPEGILAQAPEDVFVVVMTHDHDLDYRIARAALARGVFSYLGVIGSETKGVKFKKRLQAEGFSVDRLRCPIGLAGVKGKLPREIAISLTADLLAQGVTSALQTREKDAYGCPPEGCGLCQARDPLKGRAA